MPWPALPERAWRSPLTGRLITAGTGLFLTGMAVLKASWPRSPLPAPRS